MDIEKKIRKLLALSESPNEFEAQAALLKARQLMAEYKLTEAELHEGNKKVKTIKTYFIGFVGLEEDVSICVNIFTYAVDCVLTQIQSLVRKKK